jgi:ADP-heptose:LPS heptosyltransferase
LHVVLTGDRAEDPSAREISRNLAHHGDRILNLAGRTSLGELGFLLRQAEVLVTRDTGPSHLAAGVGCPVTVIFGRTDPIYGPKRWRPLGDRVEILEHRLTRQAGERREAFWQRCFASITPEEVWERLSRIRIRRN